MKKLLIFLLISTGTVTLGNVSIEFNPQTELSLFRQIAINQQAALNEVDFWSLQTTEHALFLLLGLTDESFKAQAKKLYNQFQSFRNKLANSRSIYTLNQILPLLKQERQLQVAIINAMKQGKWVGWLYPSLLKHMTMELDYFVNKLNGIPYNADDEIAFWNKEAHDRIGVIPHLLDPSETSLVQEAVTIADKYFNVPAGQKETFKQSALNAIKEVNQFSEKLGANLTNIESIISKTLAEHELREGKRGQQILENLNK